MVLGPSNGHAGEGDATELRGSAHWRLAVRGLRLVGLGLLVAVGGLVTRVWSTGTGLTILAVAAGIYLVGVVVVFTDSSRPSERFQSPDPRCGRSGGCSYATLSTLGTRIGDE
jgi:hypothetical protein